jgi:iron complex transport system substrate-binding protein
MQGSSPIRVLDGTLHPFVIDFVSMIPRATLGGMNCRTIMRRCLTQGLRSGLRRTLGGYVLLACFSCIHLSHAFEVRDDRGGVLSMTQPANRIVSLLPSLSEMVCALGGCERLVGVDQHSNFPLSLKRLPSMGSGLDPNVEAILVLKPDVVIMSHAPRAVERLESLGLKVMVFEPKNQADIERTLLSLGQVLGTGGAKNLWQSIQFEIKEAAHALPPKSRGVKVYFEVSRGPYAASESSFIGEILAQLGAHNIVPSSWGAFPLLSPEFIVKANPEVIFVSAREASGLSSRAGWHLIDAVQHQHVCLISPNESDMLARPGPRLGQAAQWMARCMAAQSEVGAWR